MTSELFLFCALWVAVQYAFIGIMNIILLIGFGDAQRLSRQGAAEGNEVDQIGPLDIGTIAQAGERCVEKVRI